MEKNKKWEVTSFFLHLLAMGTMLCDHLWGTVIPGNDWLTCVGRLAFPIYAFMLVEGYFHTRNLKKYVLRLLVFAMISEIPFDLAMGSTWFYPIHQNVLWSFLISLGLIHWNEKARAKGKLWRRILVGVATVAIGYIVGLVTMVDYYHAGILMVLIFYFFRGRKWWCFLGQLLCLWYVNLEILGGFGYELVIFGRNVFLTRQGLALLALIPIWLYRGKQGYHSKPFQYLNYAFYPLHLLILALIKLL
jgi:hypothetical protein